MVYIRSIREGMDHPWTYRNHDTSGNTRSRRSGVRNSRSSGRIVRGLGVVKNITKSITIVWAGLGISARSFPRWYDSEKAYPVQLLAYIYRTSIFNVRSVVRQHLAGRYNMRLLPLSCHNPPLSITLIQAIEYVLGVQIEVPHGECEASRLSTFHHLPALFCYGSESTTRCSCWSGRFEAVNQVWKWSSAIVVHVIDHHRILQNVDVSQECWSRPSSTSSRAHWPGHFLLGART